MRNRKLEERESMVHVMEDDRVISVAGIRANNKNKFGDYHMRVGVAITSPLDDFDHITGFDKCLGRANSKDFKMKIRIESMVIAKDALLYIAKKISERIEGDIRPYTHIENYDIPASFYSRTE